METIGGIIALVGMGLGTIMFVKLLRRKIKFKKFLMYGFTALIIIGIGGSLLPNDEVAASKMVSGKKSEMKSEDTLTDSKENNCESESSKKPTEEELKAEIHGVFKLIKQEQYEDADVKIESLIDSGVKDSDIFAARGLVTFNHELINPFLDLVKKLESFTRGEYVNNNSTDKIKKDYKTLGKDIDSLKKTMPSCKSDFEKAANNTCSIKNIDTIIIRLAEIDNFLDILDKYKDLHIDMSDIREDYEDILNDIKKIAESNGFGDYIGSTMHDLVDDYSIKTGMDLLEQKDEMSYFERKIKYKLAETKINLLNKAVDLAAPSDEAKFKKLKKKLEKKEQEGENTLSQINEQYNKVYDSLEQIFKNIEDNKIILNDGTEIFLTSPSSLSEFFKWVESTP